MPVRRSRYPGSDRCPWCWYPMHPTRECVVYQRHLVSELQMQLLIATRLLEGAYGRIYNGHTEAS